MPVGVCGDVCSVAFARNLPGRVVGVGGLVAAAHCECVCVVLGKVARCRILLLRLRCVNVTVCASVDEMNGKQCKEALLISRLQPLSPPRPTASASAAHTRHPC